MRFSAAGRRGLAAIFASGLVLAVAAIPGNATASTTTTDAPRFAPTARVAPPQILWPRGVHAGPSESTATPDAGSSNNLIYHGGAVMHRPHVYLVFWGTQWKKGFKTGPGNRYTSTTVTRYNQSFYNAVGGSAWHGVQTQYCDGIQIGSVSCDSGQKPAYVQNHKYLLSGTWVDGSAAPSVIANTGLADNLVNDPLATEAVAASAHFHTTDPDALFMIFTPPGTQALAYGTVFCAYHSQVAQPGTPPVRYAFMPFTPEQGAGCGGNSVNTKDDAFGHGYLDSYTLAGGHEFEEAVTDPDNEAMVQDGWNDYQTSENGDKCAYFHEQNLRIGTSYWAVQPMWSNEANHGTGGCAVARGTGTWPVPSTP